MEKSAQLFLLSNGLLGLRVRCLPGRQLLSHLSMLLLRRRVTRTGNEHNGFRAKQ
jgi:hypothetical protein